MRLVTIDSREVGGRPGIALVSGEILDLAASASGLTASQWRPQSVVSVLAEGEEGAARVVRLIAECEQAPEAVRVEWRRAGRLLPGAGTRLMPPIRRPGLLLVVTGMSGGRAAAYIKNPHAAAGPNAEIAMPGGARQLYLAGMLGLVIGRPLFNATETQAARAIAAITLVADLGTRRLSGGVDGDSIAARQFPGACVLGPALVTLDEFPAGTGWTPTVQVNGRSVGGAGTNLAAEAPGRLVADLSSRYAFRPGDVVGVPAGLAEFELPASSAVVLSLGNTLSLAFTTGK